MHKKISVVIPTNKRLSFLKKLIYEIDSQVGNFDISIHIVHQSKRHVLVPNFLKKENIFYHNLRENNLSLAKNHGIKKAKHKIVTFIDDDVSISKNYFLLSWKFINKKKIDMLFCKIVFKGTNTPISRNMLKYNKKVNFLNANSCLSSSMWLIKNFNNQIFFDKNFGLGSKFGSGEETDLIYRNLTSNKKIFYNSEIKIFHPYDLNKKNSFRRNYLKFFNYGLGQGALPKKHLKRSHYSRV